MSQTQNVIWLDTPEDHDYPAAISYLSIIYDPGVSEQVAKQLQAAPVSQFKAKDIFRASGLSLLGVSNSHVDKDAKKIKSGTKLSPLLLVRDSALGKTVVADGYHRLCAVYGLDEDAVIPCKIVSLKA